MRLDLSEIAKTPGMTAKVDIDVPCPKSLGFVCPTPVKGRMELNNTGTLLLLTGRIKTEVQVECSRCLADFTLPVETDMEEEFRVEKVGDAMRALPLEEDEVSAELVSAGNILDVDELIRQSLLVDLPIQPLCKPDCAGLCPTCGENLNMRKCQCEVDETESPFKVLGELLSEDDEKNE